MKLKENLSKEEKKMMRSVFWRSCTMNASRTGATQ
ncbi:PTS mannose transporter subunit IID, partial [Enterococcus faecalis]